MKINTNGVSELAPDEFIKTIAQINPNPYLARLLWQRDQRDLQSLVGFLDPSKSEVNPAIELDESSQEIFDRLQVAIQSQKPIALCTQGLTGGIIATALLVHGLKDLFDEIQIFHETNVDTEYTIVPDAITAYQLLKALQITNHESLLDLVTIAILSDWIELTSETRYLFQIGIPKLQAQANVKTATRLGIHYLLNHCRKRGDRATDFTSGLGARIRALGQIDPAACFELLMVQDNAQAQAIADRAELSYIRLLSVHQELLDQVLPRVKTLDLMPGEAIVLFNPQWEMTALQTVATAVNEQFDRPVFLFTEQSSGHLWGIGCANFGLYAVMNDLGHLISRSIGPAQALQVSLSRENFELFTQMLQYQLRLRSTESQNTQSSELLLTVSDLGQSLYEAVRAIEPCGMNNPTPRFRVKNVRFSRVYAQKLKDYRQSPVIYRAVEFQLIDATHGIPGYGWGFTPDELPKGTCDAIVQLENNFVKKRYEVRLLKWIESDEQRLTMEHSIAMLDLRNLQQNQACLIPANSIQLTTCPRDWNTLQIAYRRACQLQTTLVLNYQLPEHDSWMMLLGTAKYLARSGDRISSQKWADRLSISIITLQTGIEILQDLGFKIIAKKEGLQVSRSEKSPPDVSALQENALKWARSVREERFRQRYFMQVSLAVMQAFLSSTEQEDDSVRK